MESEKEGFNKEAKYLLILKGLRTFGSIRRRQ